MRWAGCGSCWGQLGGGRGETFGSDGSETDPLFVPHLTGERTPLLDPAARGAWIGLALDHGRGHLLRAAYQGVAHEIRHAREALDAEAGRGAGTSACSAPAASGQPTAS